MPVSTTMPPEDLARLAAGRCHDPHHWLGFRQGHMRAWRPGATEVVVLWTDGTQTPLASVGEGLFEAPVKRKEVFAGDYQLKAVYPDGQSYTAHDPYAFAPTLGDTDLHLFSEGTHRRLWEKMGASLREVDGVPGTAFAVWAPNAAGVSLVGDLNFWDGR